MKKLKLTAKSEAKPVSQDLLSSVEKKYGFVPNLMSVLADSPSTLQAYLQLSELFGKSSLNAQEQQVVLIAASTENRCEYCVGAHSMIALKMAGLSDENLDALRNGAALPDAKLEALASFTRSLVKDRGFVSSAEVKKFEQAGYTDQQLLEVILGVSMKTLSNYTNHIAETPLDPAFSDFAWKAAK